MRALHALATRIARPFDRGFAISNELFLPDDLPPRDFHARVTRKGRACAVLAHQRSRLHKRLTALFAALLIPAMASAAEWPQAAAPQADAQAGTWGTLVQAADLRTSAQPPITSDADDHAPRFTLDPGGLAAAARPFRFTGTALDRARAEQCLTMAIYYEAATQPDDGQRAVAQVVLNRVAHPAFPNTVCGVVFQGSERSTGCQFTFTCDGSLARRPAAFWWDRARRVADAALGGAVYAPVGLATHYHTLQVHPAWDASLDRVITIGAHEFFRWTGLAGQKASFRVAYLGGEPMAAPHPRLASPAPDPAEDPVALERAFEASQRTAAAIVPLTAHTASPGAAALAAAPPPAYSAQVEARGGDALFKADKLPSGGGLSAQLERSGQWLAQP